MVLWSIVQPLTARSVITLCEADARNSVLVIDTLSNLAPVPLSPG